MRAVAKRLAVIVTATLLRMTIGRLMRHARAVNAGLLVMIARADGDCRAGAAVWLAVMRPRLRIMRSRLLVVRARLLVMGAGLLVVRARLLVMRPGLLVVCLGLLIIGRARIIILRSGLLIMTVLVAIANDCCACEAANDSANNGAFCARATAGNLAANHRA